MRVLLLNYEYPPLGGGAAVATEALALRLAGRGHTVDVVTSSATRTYEVQQGPGEASSALTIYRVPARRRGLHDTGFFGAGHYLVSALRPIRRLLARHRYDVVHIYFSLPTGALLPVLNVRGTPVVVSLRGSDVPGYDPSNRAVQHVHRLLLPFTRWIWRRADQVVTVSDSLGQLARETDPRLRYMIIRNGVDLDCFHPPETPQRTSGAPLRGIAVARLIERKGIADLLHAVARLASGRLELEIAGTGHEEAEFRALAERLGVAKAVHFIGAVDHEALAERYRSADFFVLAPWDEAFGGVFAEAMASGLAIIGSDVGGIPEIVKPEVNGLLVPARDPAALAAALHRMIGDAELRRAMGARNRAEAETSLSLDRVAEQYLEVYRDVNGRAQRQQAHRDGPATRA